MGSNLLLARHTPSDNTWLREFRANLVAHAREPLSHQRGGCSQKVASWTTQFHPRMPVTPCEDMPVGPRCALGGCHHAQMSRFGYLPKG